MLLGLIWRSCRGASSLLNSSGNFIRKVTNTVKAEKKEVYGSRSQTVTGTRSSDKLADSVQSVFDLALETQGPERTAQLLEQLADKLRAQAHELPRGYN